MSDLTIADTCQEIVATMAQTIDAETRGVRVLKIPGGPEVGRQITIDATGEDKLLNQCVFSVLNPAVAPAGEAVRIEFEHDKPGPAGVQRVYSVQSVRQAASGLELLENFLAESGAQVREADFRPITSAEYAHDIVLKSVKEWADYRSWQRKNGSQH